MNSTIEAFQPLHASLGRSPIFVVMCNLAKAEGKTSVVASEKKHRDQCGVSAQKMTIAMCEECMEAYSRTPVDYESFMSMAIHIRKEARRHYEMRRIKDGSFPRPGMKDVSSDTASTLPMEMFRCIFIQMSMVLDDDTWIEYMQHIFQGLPPANLRLTHLWWVDHIEIYRTLHSEAQGDGMVSRPLPTLLMLETICWNVIEKVQFVLWGSCLNSIYKTINYSPKFKRDMFDCFY